MTDLYYPTIYLYLYDLIEGLGNSEQDIKNNKNNFLEKIPNTNEVIPDSLREKIWQSPDPCTALFDYFSNNKLKQYYYNNFERYYRPLPLGDTYGLELACAVPDTDKPYSTDIFASLKTEIKNIGEKQLLANSSLGQTYLICAALSVEPSTEKINENILEDVARQCYRSFGCQQADWDQDLDGQGYLVGAKIYELSNNLTSPEHHHHTIIILYPDKQRMATGQTVFFHDWGKLFYYYHKIIWCYDQALEIKKKLKSSYEIMSEILDPKDADAQDLKHLNSILLKTRKTINDSSKYLPGIGFQAHSIKINAYNYNERKRIMNQRANKIESQATDLTFLDYFSDRVEKKYLFQINKDTEGFSLVLKLLEDTINNIKVEVEAEKVRKDKEFQTSFTLIATSVSATSATSKAWENLASSICPSPASSQTSNTSSNLCTAGALLCLYIGSFLIFLFLSHRFLLPFIKNMIKNDRE
jgi:hypothetical protein